MKKIPTIFKRNPENMAELLNEANDECFWVFGGEGVATRKYDGTCCLVKNNLLYKRREIKRGKPTPEMFTQEDFDSVTGKAVGWVPVDIKAKEDRWHAEAWAKFDDEDGTYELVGPKIQGNPEYQESHVLLAHRNADYYPGVPRTFQGLSDWLKGKDIEGIVFHHQDGRMAKIKKRDFGLKRREEK